MVVNLETADLDFDVKNLANKKKNFFFYERFLKFAS